MWYIIYAKNIDSCIKQVKNKLIQNSFACR